MKRLTLLCALLLAGTSANAQAVSYSFIEAGYQDVSASGGIDGDGYSVDGSFEFADNWYAFAGYDTASFDFGIDLDTLDAGAGFHTGISDKVDFFAELAYIRLDASVSELGSESENGYGAKIGIRAMLTEHLELAAAVAQSDVVDGFDGTALSAEAWYRFGNNFALGLGASFEDEIDRINAGFRYYFK